MSLVRQSRCRLAERLRRFRAEPVGLLRDGRDQQIGRQAERGQDDRVNQQDAERARDMAPLQAIDRPLDDRREEKRQHHQHQHTAHFDQEIGDEDDNEE